MKSRQIQWVQTPLKLLKTTPTAPAAAPAGSPAAAATARFTYASGARPLDGYTIKRGVGRGGFGEVYFATSDAGKEVALKLIRRNLDVELRGVTQCLNLKHPNLIALYDIRTDEQGDQLGGHGIRLRRIAGRRASTAIPTACRSTRRCAWMHGIAAGVAYLHDHGIVHRDLKPGNIFVDEGIVKIGDYGLSKFISCSRRSGQTESVGTVHYMAPEIANGRYGHEIDIYALGIILFEMLTGHVPFEGESVGEVLMKHLTAEPDLSRVAEPYRTIVARALAKDPAQRLASVNELIALLPPAPTGTAAAAARSPARMPPCVARPIRAWMPRRIAPPTPAIRCRMKFAVPADAPIQANPSPVGFTMRGAIYRSGGNVRIFNLGKKSRFSLSASLSRPRFFPSLWYVSSPFGYSYHSSREFWIIVGICYLIYRGRQRRRSTGDSAAKTASSKAPVGPARASRAAGAGRRTVHA